MAANAEDYYIRIQTPGLAEANDALAQLQATSAQAQAAVSGIKFASLDEGRAAIAESAAGLRELQAQMRLLQGGADVDVAAFQQLTAAINAQKSALNSAQQAYTDMGGAAADALTSAKPPPNAAVNIEALAGATTILGGAAGATAAKGINLVKFIQKLGPEATLAIIGILALVAAFAILGAAIAKGISAAGAARDEFLRLQGAAHGSAAAASELQAAITGVSAGSALSREKVEGYAVALQKAGLRGAELQRALEAAAVAGSAGGDELASKFLEDAKAAKSAGASVDELSAKMTRQLGGVAAAQALSLSVQFDKLGESVDDLFSGATLDPFLTRLRDVTGMFSQQTEIGRKLRDVITKAMDGFLASATAALPYVKGLLLGAAIAAVEMYIAFKKTEAAVAAVLAPVIELVGGVDGLSAAVATGKVIMYSLVVILGALAAVAIVVGAAIALFVGIFVAVGAAGRAMGDAIVAAWSWVVGASNAAGNAITSGIGAAIDWLSNLSLASIGSDLIAGLADGITAGIGKAVAAVTNLGSSVVAAMRTAVDSHSPSRLFFGIGDDGIDEGLAQGVDAGKPRVDKAISGLVTPEPLKLGASKGASASGSGGFAPTFNNCSFGAGLTETKMREWLWSIWMQMSNDASPVPG